ncbi:hypothetical protein IJ579_03475 [bacterium]|nr:hypothetical protein [bacterium]
MQNENRYNNVNHESNACTSRGACSIAPNIASLQDLVLHFIKEEAHYLLELQKLGFSNRRISLDIMNDLASLVSVNEFSEDQLYSIVLNEYYLLKNIKDTYHNICLEKNIAAWDLDSDVLFNEYTTLSQSIALGEKIFMNNYKKMSPMQRKLTDILVIIVKSLSVHIVKLNDFSKFDIDAYSIILKSLDSLNKKYLSEDDLKLGIKELAKQDCRLQLRISEALFEQFGEISKVNVSHSTKHGKAILVSGNNFFDLKNVLEQTCGKNIDIYTHSNLLITHALKDFQNYPHLKGHYGDTTESCILDFATFPGAILLTKSSRQNTEYLYRGRLFSTDYTVPKGVIKIHDNDFEELIDSALEAKGFKKGKNKQDSMVGYDLTEIKSKFEKIVSALNTGKLSRLFIVGMDSYSEAQKEYFKEFFSKMKKDEYAISFFYESDNKNVLTINVGNYLPLATNIIMMFLKDYYDVKSEKLTFFCTNCNVMTISNIVMLHHSEAKNIFMSNCSASTINPAALETFVKEYNLHITSSVSDDLAKIRKK